MIEYNKVDGLNFKKSTNENTENFIKFLENKNIIVNLRKSKGKDIDKTVFGQLVNKLHNKIFNNFNFSEFSELNICMSPYIFILIKVSVISEIKTLLNMK